MPFLCLTCNFTFTDLPISGVCYLCSGFVALQYAYFAAI
uniref:Uncharacterized protein n=1 Tax=Rhizophora mucronata TaxID=61149 RepID=A0A2P2NIY2_RHIMU